MRKVTLFFILILWTTIVSAQESSHKALYLMNFTKYIVWPNETVTIGIVGNSQVLIELMALSKKYPNVTVNKISGGKGVNSCDLIFLPEAQTRNFELIQQSIGNTPIILVAENQQLINKGAEMAFFKEDDKLKFHVKQGEVYKTGLAINGRLLALANVIP